ncbi:hypothetical protein J6590_037407 [Homalodisca vitripennis]|nr:hypothetical protein J6590_037407 [Homalodisca vitripennis]
MGRNFSETSYHRMGMLLPMCFLLPLPFAPPLNHRLRCSGCLTVDLSFVQGKYPGVLLCVIAELLSQSLFPLEGCDRSKLFQGAGEQVMDNDLVAAHFFTLYCFHRPTPLRGVYEVRSSLSNGFFVFRCSWTVG